MRKAKPNDFTYKQDLSDWAIYDHHGQKIALVYDEEHAKLLVDCYNLSAFLFR